VTRPGQGTSITDIVIAFAPGEATTLWTQFLRHRAAAEKDVAELMVIGYAMDHEGYLLTVDDWLLAGYEPSITWWGPLQGEYLLEQLLEVTALAASPVKEDPAFPDFPTETWYPDWQAPFVTPDPSPEAGSLADPLPDYVFTRDGSPPQAASPEPTIPRLGGIARWTFFGNDPAMGLPQIRLQKQEADGSWSNVLTQTGAPVSDTFADIIVTYTPNPLRGTADVPDPVRTHLYHVEWQALETSSGLGVAAGLPLGNYRLTASGLRRDPGDLDYPFDGIPWSIDSDPFEVVTAPLILEAGLDGQTLTIGASYAAYTRGFRNVHMAFPPDAAMPLAPGDVIVSPGTDINRTEVGYQSLLKVGVGGLPAGLTEFVVTDAFGNSGGITVDLP
jgi:neutral ceramidase